MAKKFIITKQEQSKWGLVTTKEWVEVEENEFEELTEKEKEELRKYLSKLDLSKIFEEKEKNKK